MLRTNFNEFYRRVRGARIQSCIRAKFDSRRYFRVGCIGAIGSDVLKKAVRAVADALLEMGVRRFARE